jgi:hypothetical protein
VGTGRGPRVGSRNTEQDEDSGSWDRGPDMDRWFEEKGTGSLRTGDRKMTGDRGRGTGVFGREDQMRTGVPVDGRPDEDRRWTGIREFLDGRIG